jgi:hypothetical protein
MVDRHARDGRKLEEWIRRDGISGQKGYLRFRLQGEGEMVVVGALLPAQRFWGGVNCERAFNVRLP